MTEFDKEYCEMNHLWEYCTDESWDEETTREKQDNLEDMVCCLDTDLKKEDWLKLFDKRYVKEHLADKEKESYLFDCKEVDEIKKKIISHFG